MRCTMMKAGTRKLGKMLSGHTSMAELVTPLAIKTGYAPAASPDVAMATANLSNRL